MTNEFKYLMQLVGCGAQGKTAPMPVSDLDWQHLFQLAHEQTVFPILGYALKQNPGVPCPDELRQSAISTMRSSAISNSLKRDGIIALLGRLEEVGIHTVLLKGYAVAPEYSVPECRVSADTDIWVSPADEDRACKLLGSMGFAVEPRWANGHHAVCHHPTMGCVEVHVLLYDEIVEDVWFGKMDGSEFVIEPHEKVQTPEGDYYVLSKSDHLIFITLHMVKHFILSGMSMRMMLDMSLFMKNHRDRIDWARFWETLGNLKYDELIRAILGAVVAYAGFSEADFADASLVDDVKMNMLLDDLESGGTMGIKDKENREDGWHAYNKELLRVNKGELAYRLYMLKWQAPSYIKALFPSRRALAEKYPYVEDKPWLIPYARLHRLIFRGFRHLKKGEATRRMVKDKEEIAESGKERLVMFKKFGMI